VRIFVCANGGQISEASLGVYESAKPLNSISVFGSQPPAAQCHDISVHQPSRTLANLFLQTNSTRPIQHTQSLRQLTALNIHHASLLHSLSRYRSSLEAHLIHWLHRAGYFSSNSCVLDLNTRSPALSTAPVTRTTRRTSNYTPRRIAATMPVTT
jgi:hypothetical protein